ncbi:MAG: hypothetical protein AABX28_02735, partial [Nanoarchaeota archaeon]
KLNLKFNENIRKLSDGFVPQKFKYPLVINLNHSLDDPDVSEFQEIIAGHGGTNIALGVRPKYMTYDKNFLEGYIQEGKFHESGKTRIFFDIVIDLAYRDEGIIKNVKHWEKEMKKSAQNYIFVPDKFC